MGYTECKYTDPCVFVKKSKSGRSMYIAVYVDDMPHFFDKHDEVEMTDDKKLLMSVFNIKDLGQLTKILGMRVTRDRKLRTITLDQQQYIVNALEEFGFTECRAAKTPAQTGEAVAELNDERLQAALKQYGDRYPKVNITNYRECVGTLNYAACVTRLDIAHAVNTAARYSNAPTHGSVIMLKRILRYLSAHAHIGITYNGCNRMCVVEAYADADWAGLSRDAKSTTGWVIKLAGAAVSWCSQRQNTVATSSTEAEYIAMSEAAREIAFIRMLMADISHAQKEATVLYCDSQTALLMATDEKITKRRKHINVKHHYIREKIELNHISLRWCESGLQQADIFTKALAEPLFNRHRESLMGIGTNDKKIESLEC